MDPTLVVLATVLLARLGQLGALALHLRARTRYQREQHRTLLTLLTLTCRLPSTLLVELHDERGDATHLQVRTSAGIDSQDPS